MLLGLFSRLYKEQRWTIRCFFHVIQSILPGLNEREFPRYLALKDSLVFSCGFII